MDAADPSETPEARRRRRKREARKRYYAKYPERRKEEKKRRAARLKQDPAKWAAYKAARRGKTPIAPSPEVTALLRSLLKDPRYLLLKGARGRARQRSLPFEIKLADIVIPEFCPVLGIPLIRSQNKDATDNSPSIDRIIPELGYVRGNIAVISKRANTIKSNGTTAELRRIADWIDSVTVAQIPRNPDDPVAAKPESPGAGLPEVPVTPCS